MITVYLVPAGRQRFELYSESPDEPAAAPGRHEGFIRRWSHAASARWHDLVKDAHHGGGGRIAHWRDALVRRLAETIAEQMTLWSLHNRAAAVLRFPATLEPSGATSTLTRLLTDARRHHLRWLVIDLILFIVSGVLFFIPGPNLVAYYVAFRLIGHLRSWRGARHGMDSMTWTTQADDGLAELALLADLPRETRAPRVAAIAADLNLRRLPAFFDRVAVPSA